MLACLLHITDMYNPSKRLKDWISVPKSNSCSLHITVLEISIKNGWVQIRTQRMDEVAEKNTCCSLALQGH